MAWARRRFLRGLGVGIFAPIAASLGFSKKLLADSQDSLSYGEFSSENALVTINQRVVSRIIDDEFVLVDVDRDTFVKLNSFGKQMWEYLVGGSRGICELVNIHAATNTVPRDIASYHVMSFLADLRSLGYCQYTLSVEKDAAPLLDSPLEGNVIAFSGGRSSSGFGRSASACKTACR